MDYFVYENWVHDKAIIHKASCFCCNYGKGREIFEKITGKNDKWHGPFKNKIEAKKAALKTGRKRVAECFFCSGINKGKK